MADKTLEVSHLKQVTCTKLDRRRDRFKGRAFRIILAEKPAAKTVEILPGHFYETQDVVCNQTAPFTLPLKGEETHQLFSYSTSLEIEQQLEKPHWVGDIDLSIIDQEPACTVDGSTTMRVTFHNRRFHFGVQPLLRIKFSSGDIYKVTRFQPSLLASYGLDPVKRNTWDPARITGCSCYEGTDYNATVANPRLC